MFLKPSGMMKVCSHNFRFFSVVSMCVGGWMDGMGCRNFYDQVNNIPFSPCSRFFPCAVPDVYIFTYTFVSLCACVSMSFSISIHALQDFLLWLCAFHTVYMYTFRFGRYEIMFKHHQHIAAAAEAAAAPKE